jgi:hypothetical protein
MKIESIIIDSIEIKPSSGDFRRVLRVLGLKPVDDYTLRTPKKSGKRRYYSCIEGIDLQINTNDKTIDVFSIDRLPTKVFINDISIGDKLDLAFMLSKESTKEVFEQDNVVAVIRDLEYSMSVIDGEHQLCIYDKDYLTDLIMLSGFSRYKSEMIR